MTRPLRCNAPALAEARMVVTNPSIYAHRPRLRLMAWAALMGERGRRVDHMTLLAQIRRDEWGPHPEAVAATMGTEF